MEFAEDVAEVGAHGPLADAEDVGDGLVGEALGDKAHDGSLALAKLVGGEGFLRLQDQEDLFSVHDKGGEDGSLARSGVGWAFLPRRLGRGLGFVTGLGDKVPEELGHAVGVGGAGLGAGLARLGAGLLDSSSRCPASD